MIHKQRRGIIIMFIILMVSTIVIIDISIETDHGVVNLDIENSETSASLPTESGVFRRSSLGVEYETMSIDERQQRTLDEYYANRAFPGAPPIIPHELLTEGIGGNSCLQCHENGGYVEKFKSFAPVTPHPELINCRQCHVKPKVNFSFSASEWEKFPHPAIHQTALPGSPPLIPHDLQMRENCLACHAGPAAPKEILVTHPSRVNCRQCHVPANTNIQWNAVSKNPAKQIEWVRNE